jgi:hypothetical protein
MPNLPQNEEDRKRIEDEMKIRRTQAMQKQTWEMLFTENQELTPTFYEIPKEEEPEFPEAPQEQLDGLENVLGYGW